MTSPEWKARPTVYDGIQMRSRLEAKIAAELDALGADWECEPRAYASTAGQYLPDFCITNAEVMDGDRWDETLVFVEVRPTFDKAMATLERDTAILRASHPGPLITLGFFDHMPLLGYVWGDTGRDPALLVRRLAAKTNRDRPTLLIDQVALAYEMGYYAGRDSMTPPPAEVRARPSGPMVFR